jgi:hypothetical protein
MAQFDEAFLVGYIADLRGAVLIPLLNNVGLIARQVVEESVAHFALQVDRSFI